MGIHEHPCGGFLTPRACPQVAEAANAAPPACENLATRVLNATPYLASHLGVMFFNCLNHPSCIFHGGIGFPLACPIDRAPRADTVRHRIIPPTGI